MRSFERYAGEADLAHTAREQATSAEEGLAASKAWSALKTAETLSRLSLRWQQAAHDERQAAAQRAAQEAQPRTTYNWGEPMPARSEEMLIKADESEAIAARCEAEAERFGRKGERLQGQLAGMHTGNPQPAAPQPAAPRRVPRPGGQPPQPPSGNPGEGQHD